MRPAAPPLRLQQEHVVAVEVRADAAAVAGVADHQVVEPRIGHEAELLQQFMHALVMQVDALHQQRPAGLLQRRQRAAREGPVPQRPAGLAVADQARLDLLAPGQLEQRLARAIGGTMAGTAWRTSSGFFCQWRRMNCCGAQAAEQGQGLMNLHGRILIWKSLNNAWSA